MSWYVNVSVPEWESLGTAIWPWSYTFLCPRVPTIFRILVTLPFYLLQYDTVCVYFGIWFHVKYCYEATASIIISQSGSPTYAVFDTVPMQDDWLTIEEVWWPAAMDEVWGVAVKLLLKWKSVLCSALLSRLLDGRDGIYWGTRATNENVLEWVCL